jgi:DNA-binding NarL/FixJ family response regulator
MDPTNPIRLLLVDDKLIVREGVRAVLDRQLGFHVIAEAGSVYEATALDVRPDVVVTDVVLPDARGSEVITGLRGRFAPAAIFVLTDVDHDALVEGIVSAGVGGYVLKTRPGRASHGQHRFRARLTRRASRSPRCELRLMTGPRRTQPSRAPAVFVVALVWLSHPSPCLRRQCTAAAGACCSPTTTRGCVRSSC